MYFIFKNNTLIQKIFSSTVLETHIFYLTSASINGCFFFNAARSSVYFLCTVFTSDVMYYENDENKAKIQIDHDNTYAYKRM
jgi:hypothetical protein